MDRKNAISAEGIYINPGGKFILGGWAEDDTTYNSPLGNYERNVLRISCSMCLDRRMAGKIHVNSKVRE